MTKGHHARHLRYIAAAISILEAAGKTEFTTGDIISGLEKVRQERIAFYVNNPHRHHSYNGQHLPRDRPSLVGILTSYRAKLGIEAAGYRRTNGMRARTWRRKK